MILGSSETLTCSISTHNYTSDHGKHSYDSDTVADSNQLLPKNSEGMIQDKYNPPDNLQSTHKVSTLPPPYHHPLELHSATVLIDQQSQQAKKDLQYFTNPTTQLRSHGTIAARAITAYHYTQHSNMTTTQVTHNSFTLPPTSPLQAA